MSGECRLDVCEQLLGATTIPAQAQTVPEHEEEGNDSEVKTECPPHSGRPGIMRCNPNSLKMSDNPVGNPLSVQIKQSPCPTSAAVTRCGHLVPAKNPPQGGGWLASPFQGKGESASRYCWAVAGAALGVCACWAPTTFVIRRTSTRRFSARPSAVLFLAAGLSLPRPIT